MIREKLSLPKNLSVRKSEFLPRAITVNEFFDLFDTFYQLKSMEGLSERSLKNYKNHMRYFTEFIEKEQPTNVVGCLDVELCRMYIHYMIYEKKLCNVSVNIRLRTIKAYLKWLYREEYIDTDISSRIKLLKEPKDPVKPLSDRNVLKMLKAPDMKTYDGFRDYTLMLLMLDCGVRVNEAVNIKVSDIDTKAGLIVVRGDIAKSRISRYLPVSIKTIRFL